MGFTANIAQGVGIQRAGQRNLQSTASRTAPTAAPVLPPPVVPTNLNDQADLARRRQLQQNMGAFNRADTILTSPLGLTGAGYGTRKTLLGL